MVGAEIRTFLLERSRVTSTNKENERAYHIMYQVRRAAGLGRREGGREGRRDAGREREAWKAHAPPM